MRAGFVVVLIGFLALTGCNRSAKLESKEAVQKAIDAYLAQRQNLSLSNMSTELGEVKFEGDSATADVNFRSKQASGLAVSVRYKLKKNGDHWEVESSSPMAGPGGNPHGQTTTTPSPSPHGEMPLESSH